MEPPSDFSASSPGDRPDPPSPLNSPSTDPTDAELETALAEVERSLQTVKERYTQVRQDQQRQQELQARFDVVRQDLQQARLATVKAELKAELQQLQKQLEELEVALESQLFSWAGFREIFWQAVRFVGLGVVVGWILKSCAG